MNEEKLLKAFEEYKGYELGDFDIATCLQFEVYKAGAKYALEIAAEKAKTEEKYFPHELGGSHKRIGNVDKNSILNCLE